MATLAEADQKPMRQCDSSPVSEHEGRTRLPPIRILIADDHELVRRTVSALLATHPDLNVVCEASSGFEVVRKAQEHQPDVVLLDISMPDLNGLQAAPLIREAARKARILIITNHDNPFFLREAFLAGAVGFISKTDIAAELVTALRKANASEHFVSKSIPHLAEPTSIPSTGAAPSSG